jgi:hypothetical protein
VELLLITITRCNKMEADRKDREKKCFTKHVAEIQKQKDFESAPPFYPHKHVEL